MIILISILAGIGMFTVLMVCLIALVVGAGGRYAKSYRNKDINGE